MRWWVIPCSMAISLAAFAAHADDTAEPKVIEAPASDLAAPFDWSGFYAGGQLGGSWDQSSWRVESDASQYAGSVDTRPSGWLGGVYLGINRQLGAMVLGLDADIALTSAKDSSDSYYWSTAPTSGVYPDTQSTARVLWSGAARGRIGYAADRLMPYIAAGVSLGSAEFQTWQDGDPVISAKMTRAGWNAGLGVDYAATDRLILRVEYRYTDLGSQKFDNLLTDSNAELDLKSQDVRLAIGYKF